MTMEPTTKAERQRTTSSKTAIGTALGILVLYVLRGILPAEFLAANPLPEEVVMIAVAWAFARYVPHDVKLSDITGAALLGAFCAGLPAIMVIMLGGCAVQHEKIGLSFGALLPGDDVQTTTQTIWGINLDPQEMRVQVGYIRNQKTRVPTHNKEDRLGDVTSIHEISQGGNVTAKDVLEVGARSTEAEGE